MISIGFLELFINTLVYNENYHYQIMKKFAINSTKINIFINNNFMTKFYIGIDTMI